MSSEELQLHLIALGDRLFGWLSAHAVNILFIIVGAWLIRRYGSKFVISLLQHTARPDLYPTKADRDKRLKTLNSLVKAIMRIGVYIVAAIFIIGEINPNYTTALFTSAGLIGLGVGVGAQNLIKDLVNGIFIITENQYRVGDVIEVAGIGGIVEAITIRTTILRDLDGQLHHVPNGIITTTTNKTIGYSSINENIAVDYLTDVTQLEKIINHIGEELAASPEYKLVILEVLHFERIERFGDGAMIVKILGKTAPSEQWRIKGEFYRRLQSALLEADIKLAPVLPVARRAKN